jgi:steroid 5-alpha reductase family enzyme
MLKELLASLAALIFYMSMWWLVGKRRNRLDTVDAAWGGGYVIVALVAILYRQNVRTELIGLLVLLWGLRLAIHIWQRSGLKGPDPRYDTLSAKWNKQYFWLRAYFSIFLTQGLLIFVIGLPISLAGGEAVRIPAWLAIVGTALWLGGFVTEAAADSQLNKFTGLPTNKGKVLQTGLWRYSRHPNYFGELVQWWAIGILALGSKLSWLGLIGPLVLSLLIIFVSGIPSIEKRRLKNPEYQDYKRKTSPLIPLPRRQ